MSYLVNVLRKIQCKQSRPLDGADTQRW